MTLDELKDVLDETYQRYNLNDPGVFIRIGQMQAPLASIKVVEEDNNFYESVILQDDNYKDVLL
jgi:hypothetical protein